MEVFKIFVMNGKDIGRGHRFFYNCNEAVLFVGLEEYQRLSHDRLAVSEIVEEDKILRDTAVMFNCQRKMYDNERCMKVGSSISQRKFR